MSTADIAAPMSRRNYIVGLAVIAVFFFIFGSEYATAMRLNVYVFIQTTGVDSQQE